MGFFLKGFYSWNWNRNFETKKYFFRSVQFFLGEGIDQCLLYTLRVNGFTVVENHKKVAFWCFQKITKIDHFWQFWWTFLHSKCKRSSLRSQFWMRLFMWFSTTVPEFWSRKWWLTLGPKLGKGFLSNSGGKSIVPPNVFVPNEYFLQCLR